MAPLRTIVAKPGPAQRDCGGCGHDDRVKRRAPSRSRGVHAYRTMAARRSSVVVAHVEELGSRCGRDHPPGVAEGTFRKVDPVATAARL